MMAEPVIAGVHEESDMGDEEGGSILGGLGEMAGAAWDATVNVTGAAVDMAEAGGEAVLGAAAHVDAGILRAVGADELAGQIQTGADMLQDYAAANVSEAGGELAQAGQNIWGPGDPILPPPPPPGTPPMDPIPPLDPLPVPDPPVPEPEPDQG
jgi:hypothetical protein